VVVTRVLAAIAILLAPSVAWAQPDDPTPVDEAAEPEDAPEEVAPEGAATDTPEEPAPPPSLSEEVAAPVPSAPDVEPPADTGEMPTLFEITSRLVALTLYLGWPQGSSFDEGLAALGYGESPRFWGASLTASWKVLGFLWLGGQIDFRTRVWERIELAPATAMLPAALVVADVRFPLGRVLELGVRAGAGFGAMVLELNGKPNVTGVPRVHGALQLGITVYEPFRVFLQLACDYAESLAVSASGDTVSFSVAAIGLGVEGRL
jgi:hypothetical protein